MKFVILDDVKSQSIDNHHDKKVDRENLHNNNNNTYVDRYRYLDELLEKTFIADYFIDRAAVAERRGLQH
jgi:hypothetical protein